MSEMMRGSPGFRLDGAADTHTDRQRDRQVNKQQEEEVIQNLLKQSTTVSLMFVSLLLTADGDSQLHSRLLGKFHVEGSRTGDD